jgi:hypothetical protein
VAEARRRTLLLGLLASTLTHGSLVLAMLLHLRGASAGGSSAGGHGGAGDTSVDVSVAGAEATATPAPTSETPPPAPTEEGAAPLVAHISPPVSPPGDARVTHTGRVAGPTRLGAPTPGPGGDTVEGQRSNLPHAIVCKDPVVGRWEALKYSPLQGNWVNFTLLVHRAAGGVVQGTILSHTWSGGPFDTVAPRCTIGGYDMTVSMQASGHAEPSGAIRFGASRYSIVAIRCPSLDNLYAPDNFSGTIDRARQEFQSVNNDGANDVNAPYVFRRTGCLDE